MTGVENDDLIRSKEYKIIGIKDNFIVDLNHLLQLPFALEIFYKTTMRKNDQTVPNFIPPSLLASSHMILFWKVNAPLMTVKNKLSYKIEY